MFHLVMSLQLATRFKSANHEKNFMIKVLKMKVISSTRYIKRESENSTS